MSWSSICALALVLCHTIPLAIPPLSLISCHEPVYWSFCASLRAHRAPVHFVRVRSNSCSSMMSSRRCRCWRPRRRRSGRVACWCAVRVGFVVSCKVLPTAGRRGGQPRRPCRALSMGGGHRVMTGLRDCHVESSLFCSALGFIA
jgi:hypothetical protein